MKFLVTLKNANKGTTRIVEVEAQSQIDAIKIIKPQVHDNECVYSVQKEVTK